MNRRTKESVYNKLYHFFTEDKNCIYCGELGSTVDHIPALDWVSCLGSEYFTKRKIEFLLASCCWECNDTLSDKDFFTVNDRKDYLLRTYMYKYEGLLNSPDWDEEDINELSPNLQLITRNKISLKRIVNERLLTLETWI